MFFTCGTTPLPSVVGVVRPGGGESTVERLASAMQALLEGPTDEEQRQGIHSWFSAETAGFLNEVSIDDRGVAIVDFADFSSIIPNASTSAGRSQLLAELRATILQFNDIESARIHFDGSCDAFWAWFESICSPVEREDT